MLTIKNPATHDWANMSLADTCEGNAMDTHYTLRLYKLILDQLKDEPVYKLMDRVLMPVVGEFGVIEFTGLDVDPSKHHSVGRAISSLNDNIEDSMYEIDAVKNTDTFSGKDLLDILYLREGALELYPAGCTDKDAPSTSAPVLQYMLDAIDEELMSRGE